jgi:hypothetical protein
MQSLSAANTVVALPPTRCRCITAAANALYHCASAAAALLPTTSALLMHCCHRMRFRQAAAAAAVANISVVVDVTISDAIAAAAFS